MSDIRENRPTPQYVLIGYRCNSCGKEIFSTHPDGWHQFTLGHQGWGNDSHESFESLDACSVECFKEILNKEIPHLENYSEAEISGMNIMFAKKLLESLK